MAYVKTVWINDTTKLNAANMNHIEDGIATLDTGKADKVANATSGNLAKLDASGNLVDSGKNVGDFEEYDSHIMKTNVTQTMSERLTLKSDNAASNNDATPKKYVDDADAEKADKVDNATNGHFASLDANGNLLDSGKKPADYEEVDSHIMRTNVSQTMTEKLTLKANNTENDNDASTKKYTDTADAKKADKVIGATAGHFASLGANGNLLDSGESPDGLVKSVNGNTPDNVGNVTINRVPLADNLYSPDNQENFSTFTVRSSGGETSIDNGTAQLVYIDGACNKVADVAEQLTVSEAGSFHVIINKPAWRAAVSSSGDYTFTYTSNVWKLNGTDVTLSAYGLSTTGTVEDGNSFVIHYVKESIGAITVANPTAFKSYSKNLFNLTTGYARVIATSFNDDGANGYCIRGTYSTIKFSPTINGTKTNVSVTPRTLNDYSYNGFDVTENGYIFITGGNATTCISLVWSGYETQTSEAYSESTVAIPTADSSGVALPTVSYGMPAVGAIRDILSYDTKTYTKYIGRVDYSAQALAQLIEATETLTAVPSTQSLSVSITKADWRASSFGGQSGTYVFTYSTERTSWTYEDSDVALQNTGITVTGTPSNGNLITVTYVKAFLIYIRDSSSIFYVLSNPVVYSLASTVSGEYTVADFGIEELVGTTVAMSAQMLYGQNLRDKLRRDVVCVTEQEFSDAQKEQARENIGVVVNDEDDDTEVAFQFKVKEGYLCFTVIQ